MSPGTQPAAQPPVTLKLKHSMADRANYSSSEEEEEGEEEQLAEDRLSTSPPPKRKKLSSTPTNSSAASKGKQSIKLTLGPQHAHLQQPSSSSSASAGSAGSAANQGKKSYDWLQPSAAGASHSGPPERERERERSALSPGDLPNALSPGDLPIPSVSVASAASGSSTKSLGMSPAEEAIGGLLDESVDDNTSTNDNGDPSTLKKENQSAPKAKRSHHKKKASDAPPGPGRNWKKGMKKWVYTSPPLCFSLPNPLGLPSCKGKYSRADTIILLV